ncbi:MAG: hypothetical protein ACOY0T_35235 [Myxococcota bacterium]
MGLRHVMGRLARLRPGAPALLGFVVASVVACAVLAVPRAESTSGQLLAPSVPRRPDWVAVVVALDGVRWQEVFSGVDPGLAERASLPASERRSAHELMPELHALIDAGAVALGAEGSEVYASGPDFVSLPGYSEILGGRRESRCVDNSCSGALVPTILDQCAELTRERWACAAIASWSAIERVAALDRSRVALSTGRYGGGDTRRVLSEDASTHALLQKAEHQAPYPGYADFRPDVHTARIALAYLKRHRPNVLFVGLGEPDEYGHRNDYRGYLASLTASDARIGEFSRALAELAKKGTRTALFVTTDHGRAKSFAEHGARYPESARSFVVVAGSEAERFGVRQRGERRLADIAPTLREMFGLTRDRHPQAGTSLLEARAASVTAARARSLAALARADTGESGPVR